MEYDYYKVDLVKKSYTEAYVKIPKGEKLKFQDVNLLIPEFIEDIHDYDWDDFGWEKDVDIHEISKVSEKEATIYPVYDATDHFPKPQEPVDPNQMTFEL